MENEAKQVIIMRKDLKMRKGKIAAQAAHASLGAILNLGWFTSDTEFTVKFNKKNPSHRAAMEWVSGRFKKICVYVESEQELLDYYQKAVDAGLISAIITDAGLTEFNGVPTKTCASLLGYASDVDRITGNLPLY